MVISDSTSGLHEWISSRKINTGRGESTHIYRSCLDAIKEGNGEKRFFAKRFKMMLSVVAVLRFSYSEQK